MHELQCVGATETVTGSRHIIGCGKSGFRLLLDCGLFQGEGKNTGIWNRKFGFDPREIDSVVLSHAHIDHSGALPLLVKQGFRGKIYSTRATYDLCNILLFDSAEIQEKDIEYVNKKRKAEGHDLLKPLYTTEDVKNTLALFVTVPFEKNFSVGPYSVRFFATGHIPGSAAIYIQLEKNLSFIFSGDVGRYRDMLLKPPVSIPSANYVMMESTYGGKVHDDPEDVIQVFRRIIQRACFEKKGVLVIPAFSVGRTQEILFILNRLYNEGFLPGSLPVFVDSPLATDATKIFHEHRHSLSKEVEAVMVSDQTPFVFPSLQFTPRAEDSKRINEKTGPFIVMASSGMLDAGRIKHHLIRYLPDEKNTILLVSFMPEHSLGKKILRREPEVRIFGKEVPVRAESLSLEFLSAHADQIELLRWVRPQLESGGLKKLFLVHGEEESKKALQKKIQPLTNAEIILPIKEKKYALE